MKKIRLFSLTLIVVFSIIGCNKNDKDEFDRKAMLTNMASTVIVPAYNQMSSDLNALHSAAQNFTITTTQGNLDALRVLYIDAYKSFQRCKMLDFGPMKDAGVKTAMNTYPADTAKINANINALSWDINAVTNNDARGFPAIDFLLYAYGTATISAFTTDQNAAERRNYLTDITSKMKSEFDQVVAAWSAYEATFISEDGNDASSSTSLLFNEFAKDLELLKNAKVGIPAGQQTGGQTLPGYTEGHFSQISIVLAKENISGLKNLFSGAAGAGFDDYIKDVESEDVTTSLADNITTQFDICSSALTTVGSPLSDKVDSNPAAVNAAFQEIKKLVTYCKTDMSSTLGLLITFQDNDGD